MPYSVLSELPDAVKALPKHAQEIYMAAFNSAFKQYDGDEGKSHGTAWAAVKTKYEKNGQGNWVAKEAMHPHGEHTCYCWKCDYEIVVGEGVKCNTQDCPECGTRMRAKDIGERRESMTNTDELQAKYSEIIQEAGKRNATLDATRIKKIVELCQELLSSEEPDEAKVKEGLKEATLVLAWLKEQAAMKTEDGVKYPAGAFAYVPDAEKPSEWKLRLWEDPDKKITRAQLGRAAAALSPGGFRGQKVQIPSAEMAAVKRKIRTEYRKLGIEDEEIPRWVKEAEIRSHIRESIEIPIEEVSRDNLSKGILPVRFLRPGFNENKSRYYAETAVADACTVLDGMQMFANHQTETEAKERPEGDIRDWVAVLESKGISDKGNAIGISRIHSPWFKEMVTGLYEQGTLNRLGVSINAIGKGNKGTIDGLETLIVERITGGRSVDFVTLPGAGGVAGLVEVDNKLSEIDVELINLTTLKERRPDLVKAIESATKAEITKEVKKSMENEEKIKELEGQIETLTTERDGLKEAALKAERDKVKAEAQATIKEAVDKAELPGAAKARLLERFADVETAEGIEEAIKAEIDYIAKLSESGKVKNLGPTKADSAKDREALKESFKHMHPEWTEAQIETAVTGR